MSFTPPSGIIGTYSNQSSIGNGPNNPTGTQSPYNPGGSSGGSNGGGTGQGGGGNGGGDANGSHPMPNNRTRCPSTQRSGYSNPGNTTPVYCMTCAELNCYSNVCTPTSPPPGPPPKPCCLPCGECGPPPSPGGMGGGPGAGNAGGGGPGLMSGNGSPANQTRGLA